MLIQDQRDIWGFQIVALVGFIFLGLFPFLGLCLLLIPQVSGIDFMDFAPSQDFTNPKYMDGLIVMQILYHTFCYVIPGILFLKFFNTNKERFIGARPSKKILHYLLAILVLVSSFGFVGLLGQWNKLIPMPQSWIDTEEMTTKATAAILDIKTLGRYLLTIFYIAVLPAIGEELLFRGAIQQILYRVFQKNAAHIAIVVTAILFGVMHGQMQSVLPRIFLGILLGYTFYFSGSLWPSIIAHFFNNALQVTLGYFSKIGVTKIDLDAVDKVSVYMGLLSLGICLLLLFVFHKNRSIVPKLNEQNELDQNL